MLNLLHAMVNVFNMILYLRYKCKFSTNLCVVFFGANESVLAQT